MKSKIVKHKKKKGQVWTLDFIIGLMLFIVVIFVVVRIVFDMLPSQDYTVVYRDAVHLSDNLLSSGYPEDWNETSVILPGIANNNRIDVIKLSHFKDLEYYKAKTLLHTTSDFIFFIHNSTNIINTGKCFYGYNLPASANCTPDLTTAQYDHLVVIDRTIIYNSTVMTLTVYAWD